MQLKQDIIDDMLTCFTYKQAKPMYMIRRVGGDYLMLGKQNGRFATRGGAICSLGHTIKYSLRRIVSHAIQDGKMTVPSGENYSSYSHRYACDHYSEVRDELFNQGLLEIVQV